MYTATRITIANSYIIHEHLSDELEWIWDDDYSSAVLNYGKAAYDYFKYTGAAINMQQPRENESSAYISENSQEDEERSIQVESYNEGRSSEIGKKAKSNFLSFRWSDYSIIIISL